MADQQITDWTPPAQLMNAGHPCQPANGPRISQLLIATTPYSFNGTAAKYIKFAGVAFADTGVTVSAPFQVSVDGSDFTVLDFVPGNPCFSFTIWAPLSILQSHLLRIPYSTGVKSAVVTGDAPPAVSSSSTRASTSSSGTPSTTSTPISTSGSISQTSSTRSTQSSASPVSSTSSETSSTPTGATPHNSVSAAVIVPAVIVPVVAIAGFTLFLLFYLRRRHRRRLNADNASTTPYSPATSSGAPASLGPLVSAQDRKVAVLGKGEYQNTTTSPSTSGSPSTQAPSSTGDTSGEEEHVRELASAMRNAGLTPAGLFSLLRRPSRAARGDPDADHDAEPLPGYHA